MAEYYSAVLTDSGAALLAAAEIGDAQIEFTKLYTGDGEYSSSELLNLVRRTALKSEKQQFPFSTIKKTEPSTVLLRTPITNDDLETGYYVREVGVYAKNSLDDSAPILYSIAVATTPDFLPAFDEITVTITQEFYLSISGDLELTIEASSGAYALQEDLNGLQKGIDNVNSRVDDLQDDVNNIDDRVRDIELFKFPNATIIGNPVINNGQVSGFSSANYLQFPYLVDFYNKQFVIDTEVTTGTNVTTAQKIFDSYYGISFGVDGGKFLLAISSNGSSWNIVNKTGEFTVEPNTTYRLKLTWDKSVYKLSVSVDGGESYTEDITASSSSSPASKQVYIGIRYNKVSPFLGIINLNRSALTINSVLEWQGMDDVGIASRMDRDLSNITNTGKDKVRSLALEGVKPEVSKSQGRNIIPFLYSDGWFKTENGIFFTVNEDGSITIDGATSSGGAVFYLLDKGGKLIDPYRSYMLSTTTPIPEMDSVGLFVTWFDGDRVVSELGVRYEGEASKEIFPMWMDYTDIAISIRVEPNKTINPVTFYPMLEEGTIAHAYEPTPESNATLKKALGDTDISQIGDGTVTGSINTLSNSIGLLVGNCETSSGVQEKIVDLPGFELIKGIVVEVKFSQSPTLYSGKPLKLNINNTGAINVTYKGKIAGVDFSGSPDSKIVWRKSIKVMYDGNSYNIIDPPQTLYTSDLSLEIESIPANTVWDMLIDDSTKALFYDSGLITVRTIENWDGEYEQKVIVNSIRVEVSFAGERTFCTVFNPTSQPVSEIYISFARWYTLKEN